MWALRPHSAAVVRSVPVCGAAGTWAARCVRPLSVTASPLWPVGVHVGGGGVGGGVAFAVAVAGNDVSVSRVFVDATSRRRCSALAATGQSRGRRTGRLGADARHVHGGYGDSGDSGGVGGGGGSDIIGGSGGGGGDMLHAAQRAAATGNVMECIAVLGQASRDDLQGAVGTALFNATLSATLYRLRWGHRSGRSKLIATDDMWARGGVRGRGFDLGPPPRQFLDVPPFVERAMDTVGCTRDPTTHYLLIMTYALVGSARAAASRLRDSLQAKRNGLRNATKPATAVIRRLLMAQDTETGVALLHDCQARGVHFTTASYAMFIAACMRGPKPQLDLALSFLATSQEDTAFQPNPHFFNAALAAVCAVDDPEPLQSMMELCRRYPEAVDDNLTQRQLLQHYLRSMPLKAAVRKVSELLGHDVRTDLTLFVQLINACAESGDASQAESLFASLREFGLAPNSTAYGALLKAHIAAKDLARCEDVVAGMPPEAVTVPILNHLVSGYLQQGSAEEALGAVDRMLQAHLQPDNVTVKLLFMSLVRGGHLYEASELLHSHRSSMDLRAVKHCLQAIMEGCAAVVDPEFSMPSPDDTMSPPRWLWLYHAAELGAAPAARRWLPSNPQRCLIPHVPGAPIPSRRPPTFGRRAKDRATLVLRNVVWRAEKLDVRVAPYFTQLLRRRGLMPAVDKRHRKRR